MSAENRITVTCPVDHFQWSIDIADLKATEQVIYKITGEQHIESYRVKCPKDGTYVIVDVQVED
jgi:hypothetical protein